MPNLEECKKPDGSYDWTKYNALQEQERDVRKAKGELCREKGCNRFIMWSKGYPQTCSDCEALDAPEELHHPTDIRCPKCGYHWDIWDGEYYEIANEGEHEVECPECDHKFEVSTSVSYSFKSPERLKEPENDRED